MTSARRADDEEYSRAMAPFPARPRPAKALAGAVVAGAALLVAATLTTVVEPDRAGWDRHGPALLVLAAFAPLLVAGSLRGARSSAGAVAALGLAGLAIALGADAPDLHAHSGPGLGFWAEVAGSLLLLVTGTTAALGAGVLGGRGGANAERARYQR
jgi:peptidoglycan/LPS O-acetylase OafA/YrhL